MKNSNTYSVNIMPLTRLEKIKIFFSRSKLDYVILGRRLGLTANAVAKSVKSETISSQRREQLIEVGFPAELLPPVKDHNKGRKPK